MSTIPPARLLELIRPYWETPVDTGESGRREAHGPQAQLEDLSALLPKLGIYLDLLQRWGQKTNLTAIRDPEQQVSRHFGESLFAARVLAPSLQPGSAVLDLGSGAGFPGLPLQLLLPEVRVTLAESQGKKAAFLREAVRSLGAGAVVWAARVEDLPMGLQFDAVTLRAVDRPREALAEARRRVRPAGWLLHLRGAADGALAAQDQSTATVCSVPIPGLKAGWVDLMQG